MNTRISTHADTVTIEGWAQTSSLSGKRIAGLEITAKASDGTETSASIHLDEAQLRLLSQAHNITIKES